MKCCHLKHKNEVCTLDLNDDGAQIRDAAGNVRAQFTRDQAAQFLLPSFSETVKQFRAPVDGELWYFNVARDDLKQIKAHIEQAVVAAGPEAVSTVRNRAIRDALIGLGSVGLGVALTVGSDSHAGQDPQGGEYFVTLGLVLFGLVMIGKGVYGFLRYRQLQKLSQT
jgi:hypothetical protein